MTTCPCGHPAKTAYLCRVCSGKLGRDLATIASLWRESAVTLTRTDKVGAGSAGASASRSHPLPVNMHASEVRDVVSNTVTTWLRDMAGDDIPDGVRSIPQACSWLRAELASIVLHPQSPVMSEEIEYAARIIERLVDRPEAPVYLGMHECGSDVWARSHEDYKTCDCGLILDLEEMREAGRQRGRDEYATAATICGAARLYGVRITRQQISRWYRDGNLEGSHRKRDDGRVMEYRVGKVIDLAMAVEARRTA